MAVDTVVVDTMVFAYALLGVKPFAERAAAAIDKAEEIAVPDGLFAELANVTWQWIRSKDVDLKRGQDLIADIRPLIAEVVPTAALWAEAIDLSVHRNHPAYDTIFVALAASRNAKVVTFDQRMLKRFPEHTVSCDCFLAGEAARPPEDMPPGDSPAVDLRASPKEGDGASTPEEPSQ